MFIKSTISESGGYATVTISSCSSGGCLSISSSVLMISNGAAVRSNWFSLWFEIKYTCCWQKVRLIPETDFACLIMMTHVLKRSGGVWSNSGCVFNNTLRWIPSYSHRVHGGSCKVGVYFKSATPKKFKAFVWQWTQLLAGYEAIRVAIAPAHQSSHLPCFNTPLMPPSSTPRLLAARLTELTS